MGKSKTVKTIGVIGLGSIGMRHADNLKDMGYKVAGYDPFKAIAWSEIASCDAVVIASPTNTHLQEMWNVHFDTPIFVEKPIASEMADIPNNVTMVGYNLRFHSCVKKAKKWIDAGFLGHPLWANFTVGQYNDKPAYLRDGVILNWSHEIDLALYLLGPGSVVGSSTRLSTGKYDDITDIIISHHNWMCNSVIHLDYVTRPEVRQAIIVGSESTIIFDLVHRVAWLRDKDDVIIDQHEGQDTWDDNYKEEMQAFIDRIDGKETIGCTAEEALDVLKICLKVRKQAGLS